MAAVPVVGQPVVGPAGGDASEEEDDDEEQLGLLDPPQEVVEVVPAQQSPPPPYQAGRTGAIPRLQDRRTHRSGVLLAGAAGGMEAMSAAATAFVTERRRRLSAYIRPEEERMGRIGSYRQAVRVELTQMPGMAALDAAQRAEDAANARVYAEEEEAAAAAAAAAATDGTEMENVELTVRRRNEETED